MLKKDCNVLNVLSLFDGMACGMLAMLKAGVDVENYYAYEIDKYAVKTALHNFPNIHERGDVFQEDFTQYKNIDFLVGGSPCTYWSIAQTKNRETEASGLGWELFSQYVRALHEAQPLFFIYENNKSMAKSIRDQIRATFGFEEVCINSALLSAQNRQRYYWVGKRNEDGSYSKVDVRQPKDLCIMLRDVLDKAGSQDLTKREMKYMVRQTAGGRNHFDYGYIQNGTRDKGACLTANLSKGVPYNVLIEPLYTDSLVQVGSLPRPNGELSTSAGMRIYSIDGKGRYLCANGGGQGAKTGLYAVPVDGMEFMCLTNGETMNVPEATQKGYTTIKQGGCIDVSHPSSQTRRGRNMDKKCNCLTDHTDYYQYVGVMQQAIPCEWDEDGNPTKAKSLEDGNTYNVYWVKDKMISIDGVQYPIKLIDGYYIIRKLSVAECKRLQTVPDWYEFPVSRTQALKMLGNGWTCSVITHIINECLNT